MKQKTAKIPRGDAKTRRKFRFVRGRFRLPPCADAAERE
jgi:hypothetical protein